MKIQKWVLVASVSALLVGSALVRADTGTRNQGGIADIVTKESTPSVGATKMDTTQDTGRFLSHDEIVALGGVGNYLTRPEAGKYDEKVAENQRLANMQSAGQVGVKPKPSADEGVVFFNFGKSSLSGDDKLQIAKLSDQLKKDPALRVEINGYTDSLGSDQFNQKLSEARADSVKSELISHGVKPEQITSYAYGEMEPIASNDTSAGRSVNRRAEMYVENASTTG